MTGELVLLTGGTGFLGYAILVDLLKSDYRVRVTARSQEKIDRVLAAPSIAALKPSSSQLMFVLVADMTVTGVYDKAVAGVDFIIHAASPLPDRGKGSAFSKEELEEVFVTSSVKGNLSILKSANDHGKTVKRIVMTSSTVALAPTDLFNTETRRHMAIQGPEHRAAVPPPPYDSEFLAYCAGKAAALNAAEAYTRDNATNFDLISIIPSWIFGRDELVTDTDGIRTDSTKALISSLLTGSHAVGSIGNAVLCTDVARAHVRALDLDIAGNQSFLLNSEVKWEDTVPIVKNYFPDTFKSGRFQESKSQPTIPLKWDTSKVCARSLLPPCRSDQLLIRNFEDARYSWYRPCRLRYDGQGGGGPVSGSGSRMMIMMMIKCKPCSRNFNRNCAANIG